MVVFTVPDMSGFPMEISKFSKLLRNYQEIMFFDEIPQNVTDKPDMSESALFDTEKCTF